MRKDEYDAWFSSVFHIKCYPAPRLNDNWGNKDSEVGYFPKVSETIGFEAFN